MAPSILSAEIPEVEVPVKMSQTLKSPETPSKRHEEYQYLDLIRDCIEIGEHRPDRLITFPESTITY